MSGGRISSGVRETRSSQQTSSWEVGDSRKDLGRCVRGEDLALGASVHCSASSGTSGGWGSIISIGNWVEHERCCYIHGHATSTISEVRSGRSHGGIRETSNCCSVWGEPSSGTRIPLSRGAIQEETEDLTDQENYNYYLYN